MNNPPHLLHNNGVYFSLAAAAKNPSSLCCRVSPFNSASYLQNLFAHRQRARKLFPLILHGEGKRDQHFVCDLARAGHSLRISHGRAGSRRKQPRKSTPSYGRPANFGHMNTKKRMKTHKESEVKEAAPAKPSEDCIARLFEQQPLRLQNNNATFQCAPQEPNTRAHKALRLEREKVLSYTNGLDGDVKLKPDFSIKLLDILANFKRDNQVNDVKSTGVIDSQPVENNLGEDAMQQHPQYNVFESSESQRELTVDMERQSRIMDATSSKGTQKDEIHSYAMLDSSREDILDSPLVCEGTRDSQLALEELDDDSSREDILVSPLVCKGVWDNQLALEEPDFDSESSDDDSYNEVENRQAIHEGENLSLQHANGLFEGKRRLLSDSSLPVLSGKGWSHVFPRHLSRSTGSRSRPSKSSIAGLRSKYSKPDPKANRQLRLIRKPLQLLPNFEVRAIEREGEDEEDDVTLKFFQKAHEQPETELEEHISFDWWDSDEEDDSRSGVKLPMGSEVERRPSELIGNSKLETESRNLSQLEGEAEDLGSSRSFESLCKQTETKPEQCISFEWSDSDEEGDLNVEDSMFEWSDSDAESDSRAEEKSFFKWKDDDAEDVGVENGMLSATSGQSTWHSKGVATSNFEWSDLDAESNSRAEEKSFPKGKDDDAEVDVGMKNCILSATSQPPISSEIEGQFTGGKKGAATSNKGVATSNLGPSSDQALTCYNREDYQNSRANQISNRDGLHRLPASVKFVEAPSWKSPIFPDFPFEIQYSYSEIPKAPILGFRDHFSPFAPNTLERPWTGGAHQKPKGIEPFDCALERKKAFELTFNRKRQAPKRMKSREEILGKPLTEDEIISLVQDCHEENRQVNLGRDGLTHNMLHLIHTHWKRRPVCKIKCRGVPTLDMDNVCFHVEDKTGGQIIYRCGGTVYVFRGRNYVYQDRPVVPVMLYRPSSPVYPKLVPQAPAGLTIDEAHQLRILGQKVKPLLKLGQNTVLLNLLADVRDAFRVDDLVSLDYEGVNPRDYRQIGAKLMELVPCVLLSFRNNRIVLWKGRNSKPLSIRSPETYVAEPSLEATDVEGSCISASETKDKGPGNGFSLFEQDVLPAQSDFSKEGSTQHRHLDKDFVCEPNLTDDSDVISEKVSEQHWHTKIDDDSTISVGSEHLDGGHQSRFPPIRVDDLWEAALKYGLAVELEDVDLEADLILHKVTVFSEVAPAGPVYTDKLVNRLRLRGVYRKTQKRFVVPLHDIRRKYRPTKNIVKQAPKIEMPPRTGLQTDDLVKKLGCTYM